MCNNQLSKFIVLLKIKYLKHIFLLEINIVLIVKFYTDRFYENMLR